MYTPLVVLLLFFTISVLSNSATQIHVAYRLLKSSYTLDALKTAWRNQGATKYAFATTIAVGSLESTKLFDVYITIKGSSHRYDYTFLKVAQTSATFLEEANRLGAKGFRLKDLLYNNTEQLFGYIRDTSRPSAKYIYKHLPCVDNVSEFTFQANQQALSGYQYISMLELDNLCSVYIKDTSTKSKFVCEMSPSYSSIEAFVEGANSQGAKGYQYIGEHLILLGSGNTTNYAFWRAFYRDTTQPSCTYNYRAFENPNTNFLYSQQLSKQATEGFIFLTSFLGPNYIRYTYYIKINDCQIGTINIDNL